MAGIENGWRLPPSGGRTRDGPLNECSSRWYVAILNDISLYSLRQGLSEIVSISHMERTAGGNAVERDGHLRYLRVGACVLKVPKKALSS
ncbi:hypothetical protein SAMN04489740_2138 [Arthrobacter alpinus]|uniref:Uncharacterized protein n=1 Tax=Arthrobacter alpinus TaxID=656366 RepID=A0A1H5KTQ2_9MICC|nr:hypothetical protein SAMN04489740_2138 [Arthrobacter alpinus]